MRGSVGTVEVRPVRDAAELDRALALRERVFCGEQGVDPAADRDGLDGEALQFAAVEDGRVLGTCRVLIREGVGRLGRMAVEPSDSQMPVPANATCITWRAKSHAR